MPAMWRSTVHTEPHLRRMSKSTGRGDMTRFQRNHQIGGLPESYSQQEPGTSLCSHPFSPSRQPGSQDKYNSHEEGGKASEPEIPADDAERFST